MQPRQTFAALFGLLFFAVPIQESTADSLRDAAVISTANSSSVKFNEVYRVNPHNTYNPNIWPSLTAALDEGARVLEIDVYGGGPDLGSSFTHAIADSLRQTINHQAITPNGSQRNVGFAVKHCPNCEDSWTASGPVALLYDGYNLLFGDAESASYGNNCDQTVASTKVGYMNTSLSACLQTVRNWMDQHPTATPLMLYFDIKQNMPPGQALAFDATLRAIFEDKLFTPTDLRKNGSKEYATPRERITSGEGWPTEESLRGKALGIYTGGEAFAIFSDETPNDTLRYYVNALHDNGFEPATFVCPKIVPSDNPNDNDAMQPYGFGRGAGITPGSALANRLMGNVVCNNVYVGKEKDALNKLHTHNTSYEDASKLIAQSKDLNLLTYVWGYEDPLALFPSVTMDLVRRGANWFDIDQTKEGFNDFSRSPLEFQTLKVLPWEGVRGITSYGFVLRQRNSPTFVLAADGSKLALQPYNGSRAQQWGMSSTGRLFTLQDQTQCIGLQPSRTESNTDILVRRGSIYTSFPPVSYKVEPETKALMVPCNNASFDTYFTIVPANQRNNEDEPIRPTKPDHPPLHTPVRASMAAIMPTAAPAQLPSQMGVLIRLNANKEIGSSGLILTPSAYNESAIITASGRAFDKYRLPSGATTETPLIARGPTATYDQENPDNTNASNDYIYRQEFEIVFDKTNAQLLSDPSIVTPPKQNIIGGSETLASFSPPETWRKFSLTSANINTVLTDGLMPEVEKGLWSWAYDIDAGHHGFDGQVTNGTLPWTGMTRNIYVDPRFQGSVSSQMAAAQFMPSGEYQKWLSAIRTKADDVPADADDWAELALNNEEALDWRDGDAQAISAPYTYWQIKNRKQIWFTAQYLLADVDQDGSRIPNVEYDKWQQRLKYLPRDIYLDPSVDYVAKQLLEIEELGNTRRRPNGEIDQYENEKKNCAIVPAGVNPDDYCGNRFLTRTLGSDGHYHQNGGDGLYHWMDIPFTASHLVLAEAAFNPPDPTLASHKQPLDWALWSKAEALQEAAGARPLTYKDIPTGTDYHTIVTGSAFLSEAETAKYLEKERLEAQYVSQHKPITYLDIEPDETVAEVAAQYLSPSDLPLWHERASVELADVPASKQFLSSPNAAKLLSTAELAALTDIVSAPGHVDDVLPSIWLDVPPAKGKRFVAQTLLSATEYNKWLDLQTATEDDFPQIYTNATVDDVAQKTLKPDNYSAWVQRLGATPTTVTSLNWLQFPHRPTSHWLAAQLLPNAEATIWMNMINQTLLPQHLGASPQAYHYARSALSAVDFAAWTNYANQQNKPLNWQAFQYDTSAIQEQIVKTLFGATSADYLAWQQWAHPNGSQTSAGN